MYSPDRYRKILNDLVSSIEKKSYRGFDAWDGLNTNRFKDIYRTKFIRLLFFHFHGNSPINLRKSFGVKKSINPKGLALMISTYVNIYQITGNTSYLEKSRILILLLIHLRNKKFKGLSWGYPFPWETLHRTLERNSPNVVTTAFVIRSLHDYYECTGDTNILKLIKFSSHFVKEHLNVYENDDGFCISYTPVDNYQVLNASLLAAEILALDSKYNSDERSRNIAVQCVNFVLKNQNGNGSWNYATSHKTGFKMDKGGYGQIDWHQGYVVESISKIVKWLDISDEEYDKSILRGLSFYRDNQFLKTGEALWRWPRKWPIDIHNQSQGIITLSNFSNSQNDFFDMAVRIADWTIDNLYSDKEKFFYYRKLPFMKIKIEYMRWAQMWMANSLSTLLLNGEKYSK